MSGLFSKIIGYFLNEVIVKTLANSKSFQRFALKMDSFITTKKTAVSNIADEAVKKGAEVIKDKAPLKEGNFVVGGIDFGAFVKEFKAEISGNTNKAPPGKK